VGEFGARRGGGWVQEPFTDAHLDFDILDGGFILGEGLWDEFLLLNDWCVWLLFHGRHFSARGDIGSRGESSHVMRAGDEAHGGGC